jgi:hypothetical protein
MIKTLKILMLGSLSAMFVIAICLANNPEVDASGPQNTGDVSASKAYTPPAGSAERKAIMDALRGDQKVIFKVYYLKVQGDWGWVDTTPLDKKGKAVAEGGANLVHKDNGAWRSLTFQSFLKILTIQWVRTMPIRSL